MLDTMLDGLNGCAGLEIFSGAPGTQSGVLSFRPLRGDCETLAQQLSERGICVRSGLHCAPYAHRSAGTLETGTIRASFSPFTDEMCVKKCCSVLRELLQ